MTAPLTRGVPRVARGAVVAALTAVLSLGAHVGTGGMAPDGVVLACLLGGLGAGCVGLSRRRWTPRPLFAVFLLTQAVVHAAAMVQHPAAATPHGPVMIAAHVVAALALVVAVLHGERTLADLVDHLWMRAQRITVAAVPATRRLLAVGPRETSAPAPAPADVLGRAPPVAV